MSRLDSFTRQYIETALWSSTDESTESGGEPLDKNYSAGDIEPATMAQMIADCASFQEHYAELLDDSGIDSERAGHDFWLSRNGHGSGFFDEDTIDEKFQDKLQDAADSYGEFHLGVGDDGEIYGDPLKGSRDVNERRRPGVRSRYARPKAAIGPVVTRGKVRAGRLTLRDYEAVDNSGRRVAGPFKHYSDAKGKADQARGYVKFVPGEAREAPTPASRRKQLPPHSTSALKLAGELSKRVGGGTPKAIPGGFRYSDQNEAAQFTTYSPEHSQKVVCVVSVFNEDGSIAQTFFSDEGLSGTATYENISNFTYAKPDLAEMQKDIEWVWKTVDEYAQSWQDDADNELDESKPGAREGSAFNVGDLLLLQYGNGTQAVRIREITNRGGFKLDRFYPGGGWDTKSKSSIRPDDHRIIGRLPEHDKRRSMPGFHSA